MAATTCNQSSRGQRHAAKPPNTPNARNAKCAATTAYATTRKSTEQSYGAQTHTAARIGQGRPTRAAEPAGEPLQAARQQGAHHIEATLGEHSAARVGCRGT